MPLELQTPAELCALCYDTLTVNDNIIDDVNDDADLVRVTTQCCLEPICFNCAELARPVELACLVQLACLVELGGSTEVTTSYFTCGNCNVQTVLRRNNFPES